MQFPHPQAKEPLLWVQEDQDDELELGELKHQITIGKLTNHLCQS